MTAHTTRTTVPALVLGLGLVLTTAGCGTSAEEANRTTCDDFSATFTQLYDDVTAAGKDEKARAEAYTSAADKLEELATTEGIDSELADQLEAGAEASRAEADGTNDDVIEPDRTLRETTGICAELRG